MIWMTTFVDSGVYKNEKEVKKSYSTLSACILLALVFLSPLFGYLADKVKAKVMIPLSFILSSLACTLFVLSAETPKSLGNMVLIVLIISCVVCCSISI
jgi:MFS family permease